MPQERRFPTPPSMLATRPTPFFLAQSAALNGIHFRLASARKAGCSGCAKVSDYMSMSVPSSCWSPLRGISPLRADRLGDLDLEIVRELAGGMYFGERGNVVEKGVERAFDTESYSTSEIERIATFAFARAESRSRRVCSIDKANVLASSQLWRRTVTAMSAAYPGIRLEHMYVDNAAMQLTLAASAVRRNTHHEHVRRHPKRCRGRPGRIDRRNSIGQLRVGRAAL